MCLERVLADNIESRSPAQEDTHVNFMRNFLLFTRRLRTVPLDHTYDITCAKQITTEEYTSYKAVEQYEASSVVDLQALIRCVVLPLELGMREDFPSALPANEATVKQPKFWRHATPTSNVHVSTYYRQSVVENESGFSVIPPCTAVVGNRVLLCVELFFDKSNVVVYRDILAPLDVLLRDALSAFSLVQRFASDTLYSHIGHSQEIGWHVIGFSERMLNMPLGQVLREKPVIDSNSVDFFRISPMGVEEHCDG